MLAGLGRVVTRGRVQGWRGMLSEVEGKMKSVEEALGYLTDDALVVTAMAACEPGAFFNNAHRIHELHGTRGVQIQCANPREAYPCFAWSGGEEGADDKAVSGMIRMGEEGSVGETGIGEIKVMFLTPATRSAQGQDLVHYVPQHLSQWCGNIQRTRGERGVDVFWGSCSLPDERGFVSLGPSAVFEPEILRHARKVVLEINPNLPFCFGAPIIQTKDVDAFVHAPSEILTLQPAVPNRVDERIADFVVDLVPDGATIQLGIGGIPNAVASLLKSKRDLGVHTEMLNDAMVELFELGVITGKEKSHDNGRMTAAFALGSDKLYSFIDRNPIVNFERGSIVNNPYNFGKQTKMTSINTCVEIDITGQVVSESIGHRELSGVGGASETHTGAQLSQGGRGIIAVSSTARVKGELVSKIVFELKPGAKISISRNDIDTVVTEYGVAVLRGQSVAARAKALIGIAHPRFRAELLFEARKNGYI